jgi:hypothetical protein
MHGLSSSIYASYYNFDILKLFLQCQDFGLRDVKDIMTLPIKIITLFVEASTYIITNITARPVWFVVVLVIMSVWTFLTVVIQYEQTFCLRRLYWYVFSRIPIVWRHEGTSHTTSCHSVVTSAWWYNISYLTLSMYSIEIFGFSHSMHPIWYKTLYQIYVWCKMYISRFYFHDVISLEYEKTPMTSSLINTVSLGNNSK